MHAAATPSPRAVGLRRRGPGLAPTDPTDASEDLAPSAPTAPPEPSRGRRPRGPGAPWGLLQRLLSGADDDAPDGNARANYAALSGNDHDETDPVAAVAADGDDDDDAPLHGESPKCSSAVWSDADYCLYFELVPRPVDEDEGGGGRSNDRGPGHDDDHIAHEIVEHAAALLRDCGCLVRVFPLRGPDSELPARSRDDTRAYIVTICSAFLTVSSYSPSKAAALARRTNAPAPDRTTTPTAALPTWITRCPGFKLVAPLAGAARSQQLTRLILRECRVQHEVCAGEGDGDGSIVLFAANQRLLRELLRHDDRIRVQLFPLHRDQERHRLIASWRHQWLLQLPLTDVFQYFGPKLAMYFAWLEFYTEMLLVPAITGVLVYILRLFSAESYCLLSFVLSIGTSAFVDLWRRRQREVEYTWKYQHLLETDAVLDLETRPRFQGEWTADLVTKQRIYDFPHHKRFLRQLLAVPLLVCMCALVLAYVIALNVLSEQLRALYPVCFLKTQSPEILEREGLGTSTCLAIAQGPGVLNAVIIQVMDALYHRLALRLNEYENYRTHAEFEEHLVMKRMPFHFVNSNASLCFLAFYVRNLDRVRDRLWILMVMTQLLDNFKEVGLPFVVSLSAKFFTSDGHRRASSGRLLDLSLQSQPVLLVDRLRRVLTQKRQSHYVDTFADYKEMMIQYSYVALYTPVFPLAPLFAWLNNIMESRSDFFKLVNSNGFQRPLVQHTNGLGVWERVLMAFSVAAVIVNCAFVWTYKMHALLPTWSELHRFMLLVACEHLVFAIKAVFNVAHANLPTWIQNEKRLASLTSTHPQLLSPRNPIEQCRQFS